MPDPSRDLVVGPTLSRRVLHYKHVIQRVCIVVRSYDLVLHGYAMHRSVGATNPCPSESKPQLPQWITTHTPKNRISPGIRPYARSVRKTGLAQLDFDEAQPAEGKDEPPAQPAPTRRGKPPVSAWDDVLLGVRSGGQR